MSEHFSPDEEDFISRFREERHAPTMEQRKEEQNARTARRRSLAFNWLIGIIAVLPFVLSAMFLYSLGRIQELFGASSFTYMRENLTDKQIEELGAGAGITQLSNVVELYDKRGVIVAIIFTVAVVLIAILLAARILIRSRRSNHE